MLIQVQKQPNYLRTLQPSPNEEMCRMPAIRSQVVKKDPGARGHSNDADHEASGENHNHNSRNNWAKSVGTNSKTRGVAVVTHLVERGALTRPSWINIQSRKMLPTEQRSYDLGQLSLSLRKARVWRYHPATTFDNLQPLPMLCATIQSNGPPPTVISKVRDFTLEPIIVVLGYL